MLRRILGCFVVAALLWQLWPPYHANAETPVLIIGEVAWAGSPLSNADEWIELWNLSDEAVSLEGYWLAGAGPDDGIIFDTSHAVAPRSAFLIANYDTSHENAAHAVGPDMVTTALSLSNAKLGISLVDPEGYIVDQAGDGGTPPGGSSSPKASMIRDGSEWLTAVSSENFYADIEIFGTPSICDSCIDEEPEDPTEEEPGEDETEKSTTSTEEVTPPRPPEAEEAEVNLEETAEESSEEADDEAAEIPEAHVSIPGPQFPEVKLKIAGSFVAGEEIYFDASSSSDPNGDIVYFTWNFGDGASATGSKTAHIYESAGDYAFELIASDTTFRTFATTTLTIKPAPLPPPEVFLNEIHPAPEEGREWIELHGVTKENLPRLVGWTIEDGSGTVFRFTSSSIEEIELSEPFAVLELSSSKLNNSGDSVLLMRPDESLADGVIYDKTEKGMSWVRTPDGFGEWRDAEPSRLAKNTYVEKRPEALPAELSVSEVAAETRVTYEYEEVTVATAMAGLVQSDTAEGTDLPASAEITFANSSVKKTSESAPIKRVAAKTEPGESESSSEFLPTSIEQIMTIPPNTKVTLSGVVGSKHGLLGKHQFVLLAPNGRGLYVKASNKQPSPSYGERIRIVGTLMNNDDGLYVRMGTKDRWVPDAGNTAVKVRAGDLAEIGAEDAWSLMQITGHVVEHTKTKALIDTGSDLVEVNFKDASNYRASRLNDQDKVRVTGLLDMTGNELKLFPRDASEVEILEHASLDTVEEENEGGIPGWVPFGAAGLTIAVTEGVKRLRKWKYEQTVQKLIEKTKK